MGEIDIKLPICLLGREESKELDLACTESVGEMSDPRGKERENYEEHRDDYLDGACRVVVEAGYTEYGAEIH